MKTHLIFAVCALALTACSNLTPEQRAGIARGRKLVFRILAQAALGAAQGGKDAAIQSLKDSALESLEGLAK